MLAYKIATLYVIIKVYTGPQWIFKYMHGYRISLRVMQDFEKGKLYKKGEKENFLDCARAKKIVLN